MFLSPTVIHPLTTRENENRFFIKRDDLLPFSFGGNKARKASYFLRDILDGGYDTVVTYGSGSSNHCRVIANMAARYRLKCYIISPEEEYHETLNSALVNVFHAEILKTPVRSVSETIDRKMEQLRKVCKPYFIQGGGHGNLGTQAYVDAYKEICAYEASNGIGFDYIFHASGTGTTQAGLICGAALAGHSERKIVGISIARAKPRGQLVVEQSVADYLKTVSFNGLFPAVEFDDSYICGGYGKYNSEIVNQVKQVMRDDGVPLNLTYTGKAFWGMLSYIRKNNIKNKDILFINTGGSPLFFDDLGEMR